MVTARDLGLLTLRVNEGADMEHSAHVVVDFSLLSRNIVRAGPRKHSIFLIVCWERVRKCMATYKNQELH